jgi:hypothetical protein
MERVTRTELLQNLVGSLRLLLEGKREDSLAASEFCIRHFPDPEAVFYMARQLAQLGEPARALDVLNEVIDRGFYLSHPLSADPWLAPLRSLPAYEALVERTRRLEQDVALAFMQLGGHDLLR